MSDPRHELNPAFSSSGLDVDEMVDSFGPLFIRYGGDLSRVAAEFGLSRSQLASYIGRDDRLGRAKRDAEQAICDEAQARLISLMRDETNKSPIAAFGLLKNWRPEVWSDKKQIDVRSVGFEAAPEERDDQPRNVLLALVEGGRGGGSSEGEEVDLAGGDPGVDGGTEGGAE